MGIKEQNKNLSDAASRPKDTSPRLQKAQNDSSQVTQNHTNKKEAEQTLEKGISGTSSMRARPSFEGLSYAPAAFIQMNGTGYANQDAQKARYAKREPYNSTFINRGFTSSRTSSIINNYSNITQPNSSSERINNIVRNNMAFK